MIDIQIKEDELKISDCKDLVADDAGGAVVVFVGTVRCETNGNKVTRLNFEAFVPMAKKEMRKIAEEVIRTRSAIRVSMHHRIGSLEVGEIPVIIAVSAAHRGAAFEACQYAIDTLKETVPIWKKEIFQDGEVWVSAHP